MSRAPQREALAARGLLISVVSFPFDRYFLGTILLLPSALCAALFAAWKSIALELRAA